MRESKNSYRTMVLAGIALSVVVIFICRLASLQFGESEEFRETAEKNAIYNNVLYPSRGLIYDRNGKLLVYNQAAYDVMVVMREVKNLDTLDLCKTLGISATQFKSRMEVIKDRSRNPGYSSYTQQLFMSQIPQEEYSVLQEKLFRFSGFYVRKRSVRQYNYATGAHLLGYIAEVSLKEVNRDEYYLAGDYIGKLGVERSYEKELRGEKGIEVLLRDARGCLMGHYLDGAKDKRPVPGKDLTLSVDFDLQAYGEQLMRGRRGSIVAIEPSTGEILCCVSSPTYDPRDLTKKGRGNRLVQLGNDPSRPLFNRAVSGTYPPGSTFKPSQALTFLQEKIINLNTYYPCVAGFHYKGAKLGCHHHPSPLNLPAALATSCNGYFCWGLYYMLENRSRYSSQYQAMSTWRDYMVSMGFGYRLGVDLPGEARGMIPNADYYNKRYGKWASLSVISISIGQGEVTLTPLQIANLGATIANRGYYITPHVVKSISNGQLADSLLKKHTTMVDSKYYNNVVEGMRRAVTDGTCKGLASASYEPCGKTGTAQNIGRDHSVFLGFAPRNHPKIALAVYVENGGFGAEAAVPIARKMFDQYFLHNQKALEQTAILPEDADSIIKSDSISNVTSNDSATTTY